MKECKNFKNFKFSRKLPPTLIPFIVLNKNQHAHGKEMAIMMYDMQNLINMKRDKEAKRMCRSEFWPKCRSKHSPMEEIDEQVSIKDGAA